MGQVCFDPNTKDGHVKAQFRSWRRLEVTTAAALP
jgi:hypothetical protein